MACQMQRESLVSSFHLLYAPAACRSESLPQASGGYGEASAPLVVEAEKLANYDLSREGRSEQAPPEAWSVKRENPLTWGGKKYPLERPYPSTPLSPLPLIDCKGGSPRHVGCLHCRCLGTGNE